MHRCSHCNRVVNKLLWTFQLVDGELQEFELCVSCSESLEAYMQSELKRLLAEGARS